MRKSHISGWVFLLMLGLMQQTLAQDSLRIMDYNLLRYGAAGIGCTPTGVSARNTWISGILNLARPDIFGVNEMGPAAGPTSPSHNLLINILQPINPAYRAATITFNGFQDVTNMMYYNSDKLGLAQEAVIPEPTLNLRDINYYKFYYKGPGLALGDTTFIEVVQVHLHASDANTRAVQAEAIMHFLDSLARPGNFIVQGDFNGDGSTEQAFQNFVAHPNADCKLNDLLGLTGNWHGNTNCRPAMTQATDPNPNNPCGSGGALDDRFDHILVSNSIFNNTDDVRYIPGSYWVLGNPYAPNAAVGNTVLNYIKLMSDHHPLTIDLEISKAVSRAEPLAAVDVMRLHGNPVDSKLRLKLALGAFEGRSLKLEMTGIDGKVLKDWTFVGQGNAQTMELDIAEYAAGVYFLRLLGDDVLLDVEKVLVNQH